MNQQLFITSIEIDMTAFSIDNQSIPKKHFG